MVKLTRNGLSLLTLIAGLLAGCVPTMAQPPDVTLQAALPTPTLAPTFTPTVTATPTLIPTVTATPTPTPYSDLGLFTTEDEASIFIPGPDLAPLLPFPGEFAGEVTKDEALIGISLIPGTDHTTEIIITDSIPPPQESDIIISFEEGTSIGSAYSKKELQLSLSSYTSPQTAFEEGKMTMASPLGRGLLEMVKNNGRRIILKGLLTIPVVDPVRKNLKYVIEYTFGENASIVWDIDSGKFIWSNMTVERKSR